MTRTTDRNRVEAARGTREELRRLRAEVARLRAELHELRSHVGTDAGKNTGGLGHRKRPDAAEPVPAFPLPGQDGNYPATEALRVILARQIADRRQTAGWTQAELAERAGVRQETVSRLEGGKHAPNIRTVDRLDRALREAGV